MDVNFPQGTLLTTDPSWPDMPPEVAKAITAVMAEVRGIEKRGENTFHRFKYMTIGDLMVELQPAMAKAGLFILQTETGFEVKDGAMLVRYAFGLGHSSGAVWRSPIIQTGVAPFLNAKGGVDDKAMNKCHTAARKYFMIGIFQIPAVEIGDERIHDGDADAAPDAPAPSKKGRSVTPSAPTDKTSEERRADFSKVRRAIKAATSASGVQAAWDAHEAERMRVKAFNQAAHNTLEEDLNAAMAAFSEEGAST